VHLALPASDLVPDPQFVQIELPESDLELTPQSVQLLLEVEPSFELLLPAAHLLQSFKLVTPLAEE
jgi:hypothetical protein